MAVGHQSAVWWLWGWPAILTAAVPVGLGLATMATALVAPGLTKPAVPVAIALWPEAGHWPAVLVATAPGLAPALAALGLTATPQSCPRRSHRGPRKSQNL